MSAAADDSGRVICFHWNSSSWGLPLGAVDGVWAASPTRSLRGAPPEIVGLAALSGRIVAVIDLGRILGVEAEPKSNCLVRLAPPLESYALRVPVDVELTSLRHGVRAASIETGELDDRPPVTLLDPAVLRSKILALGAASP